MLLELAEQAAAVAIAVVPVRKSGGSRGYDEERNDARTPGFTKRNIHPRLGWNDDGHIWSSANAPADPAIFLEYPAVQMTRKYPFLTTGLDELELNGDW